MTFTIKKSDVDPSDVIEKHDSIDRFQSPIRQEKFYMTIDSSVVDCRVCGGMFSDGVICKLHSEQDYSKSTPVIYLCGDCVEKLLTEKKMESIRAQINIISS